MIVDLRIYSCQPNRMAEFVKLYETMAGSLQKKYLGRASAGTRRWRDR